MGLSEYHRPTHEVVGSHYVAAEAVADALAVRSREALADQRRRIHETYEEVPLALAADAAIISAHLAAVDELRGVRTALERLCDILAAGAPAAPAGHPAP